MIKARARIANRDTVIFGLSRTNTERLLNNMPIMFDGIEVGVPDVKFVIIAHETEQDILEDLRSVGVILPTGR